MKLTIPEPVLLKHIFIRSVVLVLLGLFSTVTLAFDYYVVNRDVEVYSAPETNKLVTRLSKGEVLLEIDKKGAWSRVFFLSADKQPLKGWLPSVSLTAQQQGTSDPDTVDGEPLIVAVNSLRLRQGPGAEFGVVGSLTRDQKVTGLITQGEWVKVVFSNDSGSTAEAWTARRFLSSATIAQKEQSNANSKVSGMFRVTGTQVNYRSGPGSSYQVVGQVSAPQQVEVTDVTKGWMKIVSNEKGSRSGWIAKRFLEPLK